MWSEDEKAAFTETRNELQGARDHLRQSFVFITNARNQRTTINDINQVLDQIDRIQSSLSEKILSGDDDE